jgi:O-antigen/teichoic acid export membrane protein
MRGFLSSRGIRLRLADEGTLGGRAARALGWNFTSNALGRLGTLGIGVMLARMLGPHAFGTYAVAWVALLAILSINDLSLDLAIVRWPGDPAEIAPTIMTMSLVSSLVVYAGCFVGAPAYASGMGTPAAAGVVRVLALTVVLDGVVATPVALLDRHFRQDRRMIADQVNQWLGAFVSIGLAWAGMGAMSLAIGRISGALAAAVLYIAFSPQPLRFGFDRTRAGALLRYCTPLAGSTIVVFAVTNLDQFVVGRMLGATTLGFYVLASNLAAWPVTIFSRPVRSVAPAAFARLQHDPTAMRAGFLSAATLLGAVTLPVCLSIGGSAAPLIGFVYGARWLPAAHVLIWLALLAALTIFFELVYDYLVVLARTRIVFTVQFVWLLALIPALIAGGRAGGMAGVGAAEAGVAACVILPWYLHELRRVGIRGRALGRRLAFPLAGAAVAGLAAIVAAKVAPNYLTALAVSGVVVLAIVGLLAARVRALLAALRAGPGGQAGPVTPASEVALTPAEALALEEAAEVPALAEVPAPAEVPALAEVPAPAEVPALAANLVARPPAAADVAAAMEAPGLPPVYGDGIGETPVHRPGAEASPVYQATVAALRWDPLSADHHSWRSLDR